MKAKTILEEARNSGLRLEFEVDINNDEPESYKDIIFNKNELEYVHEEVKSLEKKYFSMKEKSTLQNLDIYREHIKEINGVKTLIMAVKDKDVNLLKSVSDSLMNEMDNGFIFFINIKEDDSVNFIAKSNSFVNAGEIVKDAALRSEGNGGGSPKFAQGGGKTSSEIDSIVKHIEKVINNG